MCSIYWSVTFFGKNADFEKSLKCSIQSVWKCNLSQYNLPSLLFHFWRQFLKNFHQPTKIGNICVTHKTSILGKAKYWPYFCFQPKAIKHQHPKYFIGIVFNTKKLKIWSINNFIISSWSWQNIAKKNLHMPFFTCWRRSRIFHGCIIAWILCWRALTSCMTLFFFVFRSKFFVQWTSDMF